MEDCVPSSYSFTITDGIFAMGDNQPQYYIRKAKEITIFTTISADEDWIVYKFYDNNTYRLYVDSYFFQTGTYENGNDPCADGEITMDAKYTIVSSTLEPYTGEPYTTSISNNIWTIDQTQTVLRELSVFTATVINELVPSFKETVSVRFLADNKFMITKTFQMVDEIVIYYGTYTGNPCSDSEGSQEVTLTFTKKQEYEQNPQGFEDIEVTDIQTEPITIQNNKFTSTALYPNLVFTRK